MRVKRCGKSAPAPGVTRAARQTPPGARPSWGRAARPVRVAHGPQVGRSDGWPPRREAYRTPPTGRLTTTFVDSHHPRGWETPPAFVRSAALHTTSPGRAAGAEPAQTENAPVHALPYEEDPDRSWVAPAAPGLPYDGTVPPDVERLVAARRKLR